MKAYKLLIVSLLLVCCLSCTKSIFYAYHNDGAYYTLELHKHKMIFRATPAWSDGYRFTAYPKIYLYLYMESDDNENNFQGEYIFFYIQNFMTEKYGIEWKLDKAPYLSMLFSEKYYGCDDSFMYYRDGENLILRNNIDKKDSLFLDFGIYWLPDTLKLVKKIDYSKFHQSVQHLNLKQPK